MAFMHIVSITPHSVEEIYPICLTPFSAKTLLGLATDIPILSKFYIFWGDIVPSLRTRIFRLQKKAFTAGS